jgi:AcrR family transcriptional regulator
MSTARPRWRRRKDDRPTEIVSAALDCFAERGFAATRLEDIAQRAGVTKGTVYLYFPSKEELFKAVVRQFILPVLDARVEMLAASDEPVAALLRRMILSVPDAFIGSPIAAIPRLVMAEARNFPDLARFYFEEVPSRARERITAVIRRGIARGEFRRVDPDHVFYCAVSPIIMTVLWNGVFGPFDPRAPDLRAICRSHVDLLLTGLLKEREAA